MTCKRVYFIRPKGMDGPVKIGCSASPDGRRKSLEQWSPFPLEIVAEMEGGFWLEKRLHWHFHQSRLHGEWFSATDKLLLVIQSIRDGSFDAAALPTERPAEHQRRAQPSYVGKQSALTRRVNLEEYYGKIRCPIPVWDAYKEDRMADVEAAMSWVEESRKRRLRQ